MTIICQAVPNSWMVVGLVSWGMGGFSVGTPVNTNEFNSTQDSGMTVMSPSGWSHLSPCSPQILSLHCPVTF